MAEVCTCFGGRGLDAGGGGHVGGESVNPHIREVARLCMEIGRPMSCMPGYFGVINTHTVGSLTIPRASIKWL